MIRKLARYKPLHPDLLRGIDDGNLICQTTDSNSANDGVLVAEGSFERREGFEVYRADCKSIILGDGRDALRLGTDEYLG